MESNELIAPFVMKTYQMVNDSSLDNLIRWGTGNNSFIVIDSLRFSQRLLPAYFKHNNFSSFIRQLNTYGFRKVDPDCWEFANEYFLRGQVHLLKNIGRKRQTVGRSKYSSSVDTNNNNNNNNIIRVRGDRGDEEYDDEEETSVISMEIDKLKKEQKALEQELVVMNKRLEATERRPEQMMALLCKVAEDPDILQRMMMEKGQRSKRLTDKNKQRRLLTPAAAPSPASSSSVGVPVKKEDSDGYQTVGNASTSWSSSPETVWLWNKDGDDGAGFSKEPGMMNGVKVYGNGTDEGSGWFRQGTPETEINNHSPAYPFSLLGGGF